MTTSAYAPDVSVEIAFDSGYSTPAASRTWADVSAYVELEDTAAIGFGRSDERSTADANTLGLTLDNTDGRFTAGLASGAYYPNVKIGRPIRVRATYPPTAAINLLSANHASFEGGLGSWVAAGTVLPTVAQDATRFYVGTKSMKITWAGSGTNPQAQVTLSGYTIGATYTVAAWVYVPTGGPDVRVGGATSTSSLTPVKDQWVRISTTFVPTTTTPTIFIRSSGTPAASTCFVDAVMVVAGATISDYQEPGTSQTTTTRFLGYVDEWPVEWDGSESYATAKITAASRMARIGLDAPLSNIIREEHELLSPAAHYQLGEPAGSTNAYDSSANGQSRMFQTGGGTAVVFGTATGPGTDGLTAATFAVGSKRLRVNSLSGSYAGDLGISLYVSGLSTPIVSAQFAGFMDADDHGDSRFNVGVNSSGVAKTEAPAALTGTTNIADGGTHHIAVRWTDSTSTYRLYVDGVQEDSAIAGAAPDLTDSFFEVGGSSSSFWGTNMTGSLAHVAVFDGNSTFTATDVATLSTAGLTGFSGETPGTRFTRYASYASIPAAEISAETGTSPMAHVDTTGAPVLDMLHLVETTDGGVLFDAADNTLTFHGRAHRYGAAVALTLDMDAQQVESDYQPKLDRSTLANDVTASITGGTVTARAVNQTSKDDYGIHASTIELATTDEEEPQQAASWRVGIYGEPSVRVPTLTFDLLPLPVATAAQALALTVGSRVQVTNHPAQAASPTGDYFVEGYTETIGPESHVFTLNVSPAAPYAGVWQLDSASYSQLGTTTRLGY